LEEIPTAIRFGKFGREPACLIVIYENRGIAMYILDRKFTLDKCFI
jgi:hypothetical protein